MSYDSFDITQLLHPIAPADFVLNHWEKRPLVLTGRSPAHYSELLTPEKLDALIATYSASRAKTVRVLKTGQLAELGDFLYEDGRIHPSKLFAAYASGHSIALGHVRQYVPLLPLFRNLEDFFSHPFDGTIIATPPDAQAFGAHFDAVDTFILQIDGAKHWKMYDCFQPYPISEEQSISQESLPPLRHDIVLQPGDLLYIPRGFVHAAVTSGAASLSLSLYCNCRTWMDLIAGAARALAKEHAGLRAALPVGYLTQPQTMQAMQTRLRELLEVLCQQATVAAAVDQLAETLLQEDTPAEGFFARPSAASAITAATVLRKRRGARCRVVHERDAVSIQFTGGRIRGPLKIASALQFIERTSEFRVTALPDTLSDKEKLVLVRRLISDGLLTTV